MCIGDRTRSRGQRTRKSAVRRAFGTTRGAGLALANRLTFFHAVPRIAPLITNTVSPVSLSLSLSFDLPPSLCPPSHSSPLSTSPMLSAVYSFSVPQLFTQPPLTARPSANFPYVAPLLQRIFSKRIPSDPGFRRSSGLSGSILAILKRLKTLFGIFLDGNHDTTSRT